MMKVTPMEDIGLEALQAQSPQIFTQLSGLLEDLIIALPPVGVRQTLAGYNSGLLKTISSLPQTQAIVSFLKSTFHLSTLSFRFTAATDFGLAIHRQHRFSIPGPGAFKSYVGYERALATLVATADPTVGLSTEPLPKNLNLTIRFPLCFLDIQHFYPDTRFTGRGLAAMLLHEIGHVFDYLIRSSNGSRFNGITSQLAASHLDTVTQDDLLHGLDMCLDLLRTVARPKSKETQDLLTEISDIRKKAQGEEGSEASRRSLLSYVVNITTHYVSVRRSMRLYAQYIPALTVTGEQISYNERSADAFAVAYGAGPDLLIALQTAHDFMRKYQALNPKQIRAPLVLSDTSFRLGGVALLKETLDIGPSSVSMIYDSEDKRYLELLQSLYPLFKTSHMDDELRDFYLAQVSELKDLLESWDRRQTVRYRMALRRGLLLFAMYGYAPFLVFTHKLTSQYHTLQTLTRDFVDNPLFYQEKRLSKLSQI